MGDSFDLLKLMKEASKLQGMVSLQQEDLKKKQFEAEVGAGMVKVTMNGALELLAIQVEADAWESLGQDSVLDLIRAAVNEAINKTQDGIKDEMMGAFKNMAGGLLGGES